MAAPALSPALNKLFAAFPKESLRLVGGYVRTYLLTPQSLNQTEADLTTLLTPAQVKKLLADHAIPFTTQGEPWGTLTAQLNNEACEITSTRTEVYTPGSRYPHATFGASWQQDAARRDFTMNAIYLSPDGALYDPFGGEADLRAGVVKFIGDPATRVAEDPLRLLRFARFCGMYGLAGWSADVSPLFTTFAPPLSRLPTSRTSHELSLLTTTPYAHEVRKKLAQTGFPSTL